jgi:hypothetical protein
MLAGTVADILWDSYFNQPIHWTLDSNMAFAGAVTYLAITLMTQRKNQGK